MFVRHMEVSLTALLIFMERVEDPSLRGMAFELAKVDVERAVFMLGKCDLLTDACVIEEVGNFYKRSGKDTETLQLYRELHVPRPTKAMSLDWFRKHYDALIT